MSTLFPPNVVASLAARIDEQLPYRHAESSASLLIEDEPSIYRSLEPEEDVLAIQAAEIERITKERPASFLKKLRKAAKQDVCQEGGVLNAQWQRWKDLASADVVKSFGPVLVAMGFSGVLLESLVVAVGITVIHIGLKAFCEEYKEDSQEVES